MESDLLTAKQVAKVLGVSDRHVRRLSRSGEDVERVGRFYRIIGHSGPPVADPGHSGPDIGPSGPPDRTSGSDAFIILRDAHQGSTAMVRAMQQEKRELVAAHRREKFSLRVMLATCLVTILIAGSGAGVLWGWWSGRGGELRMQAQTLAAASASLAAERERVIQADQRTTAADERTKAAERRAIQARAQASLTEKNIVDVMAKNQQLAGDILELVGELESIESEGW